MDVSTAQGAQSSKRNNSDDDLLATLEMALAEPLEEKPVAVDCVTKYHEMMRRAFVDWGDEIIDTLCAKFADAPRVKSHMEAVRAELIDPLRAPLS